MSENMSKSERVMAVEIRGGNEVDSWDGVTGVSISRGRTASAESVVMNVEILDTEALKGSLLESGRERLRPSKRSWAAELIDCVVCQESRMVLLSVEIDETQSILLFGHEITYLTK